jgi:hypothetical protein
VRLSLVELKALLEHAEGVEQSIPGMPMSTGLRNILLAVLMAKVPQYYKATPQECLEWLQAHHYGIMGSDKNKRAVIAEVNAEPETDTGEIDLLANMQREATTIEEVEEEARLIDEQLGGVFEKLAKEKKRK